MPEAPELQVVKEVLERKLPGQRVEQARLLRPTVLRSLAAQDFGADIAGRECTGVARHGKSLTLTLSPDRLLVVFPMLTGAFQYCPPSERVAKVTCLVLGLSGGMELRYLDDRQMGMVYYILPEQVGEVRRLEVSEQAPDVLDQPLSFEEFQEGLKRFHGEIKGILTRGQLVAGVGNAYADEVLFQARIFPFRKRRTLTEEELGRLYDAVYSVPRQAVEVLRGLMGEDIHLKPREFLKVHGKGGQPCPACGGRITAITANQRVTNYCRRCQPGFLLRT